MALDAKRRQKKLARQKTKRKAKIQASRNSGLVAGGVNIEAALRAPIYQCLAPVDLFEMGMGSIFLSRRLTDGDLVTSVFLVDIFCLGVKDCFLRNTSISELEQQLASQPQNYQPVSPECAKKLIQGAVSFARELGIPPHRDYAKVGKIFADINEEACESAFEYGSNGRPLFIPGPDDGPAVIRRINRALAGR